MGKGVHQFYLKCSIFTNFMQIKDINEINSPPKRRYIHRQIKISKRNFNKQDMGTNNFPRYKTDELISDSKTYIPAQNLDIAVSVEHQNSKNGEI